MEKLVPTSFTPEKCKKYPQLLDFGIDCTCPFKFRSGEILIDNIELELPDASTSIATFLASGDCEITLDASDAKGKFGCLNVKFTGIIFKIFLFTIYLLNIYIYFLSQTK